MLIFQGFANSRIVREFPPFSFKVRIATLTRNRLTVNPVRGFESHALRQRSYQPRLVASFLYPELEIAFHCACRCEL